jgi:hypothetical protein
VKERVVYRALIIIPASDLYASPGGLHPHHWWSSGISPATPDDAGMIQIIVGGESLKGFRRKKGWKNKIARDVANQPGLFVARGKQPSWRIHGEMIMDLFVDCCWNISRRSLVSAH